MIVRPSTEQLLLDCANELMQGVMPFVTEHTAIVRLAMVEQVLRNSAIRSAHEIQWMCEEIPSIENYARAVADRAPREELAAGIRHLNDAADVRMDLDVVAERYRRASELLAVALDVTISAGLDALREQGEALLDARLTREETIMAGWSPTGR